MTLLGANKLGLSGATWLPISSHVLNLSPNDHSTIAQGSLGVVCTKKKSPDVPKNPPGLPVSVWPDVDIHMRTTVCANVCVWLHVHICVLFFLVKNGGRFGFRGGGGGRGGQWGNLVVEGRGRQLHASRFFFEHIVL